MKNLCDEMPSGYSESIRQRLAVIRCFGGRIFFETGTREERTARLKQEIEMSDAIVIGAGAGLSVSAGLTHSGGRFERCFFDLIEKYGIHDIYTGGFCPFPDAKMRWAWWARYIYFSRYIEPPRPVYRKFLTLVKDKDYFAITTNADHQFLRTGLDQKRLLCTQEDYGLFQTVDGKDGKIYDNEEQIIEVMTAQGSVKGVGGVFQVMEDGRITMCIPAELIPKCPDDGADLTINLHADDSFVKDAGWHRVPTAYPNLLHRHKSLRVSYLELGMGDNTPAIVKYPFWQITLANKNVVYACASYSEVFCPHEIMDRSVYIDGGIREVLELL